MNFINFWRNVDQTGGNDACWNWLRALDRYGYGVTNWRGKTVKAHRMAYLFMNGLITEGCSICHSCDNPACCNPIHLFEGSHLDNMTDRNRKGRARGGGNFNLRPSKLKPIDVVRIRSRFAEGGITKQALANEYGVSRITVLAVITGRLHKRITSVASELSIA